VRLPVSLQRSMAAEAEATREARAHCIVAEGELRSARTLRDAADIVATSPGALQLRYLQTLSSIANEKNSTIIFPMPVGGLGQLFGTMPMATTPAPPQYPPHLVLPSNKHIITRQSMYETDHSHGDSPGLSKWER
jgi:erythrocyte band 7 integral membrane protein